MTFVICLEDILHDTFGFQCVPMRKFRFIKESEASHLFLAQLAAVNQFWGDNAWIPENKAG